MLGLLEQMRSSDIVRGSHVRIRPDVKEPAFGWQDAPRDGTPGVVSDLDEDQNTVQVSYNDEIWYGKLTEVVFVDLKAEERSTVWLGVVFNTAVLPEPTANRKKLFGSLFTIVDQQLSPAIVEGIFKVGQRVKAYNQNRYYPGEVRAVLPNQLYAVAFDDGNFNDKVPEDKIALNPFQKGARVRIKNDPDVEPQYGLQRGVEKGMIGEVMDLYPYSWGSDKLRLRIKVRNGMRVVIQNMMDDEVDVVGDAKWYTRKRVKVAAPSAPSTPTATGAAFGERQASEVMGTPAVSGEATAPAAAEAAVPVATVPVGEQIPLPKSAVPTVDRAFSDGVVSADVYLRDATYTINFERMEVIHPKTNEVVGELIRDPPQQWVKQREKVTFDDGKWHVLSVLIRGDQNVVAVCDGHVIPVEYNGPTYEDGDDDEDEEGEEDEEEDEAEPPLCEGEAEEEGAVSAEAADPDVEYGNKVDLHNIVDIAMIRLLEKKPDDKDQVYDVLIAALQEYQREHDPEVEYSKQIDLHNIIDLAVVRLLESKPEDPDHVFDALIAAMEEYQQHAADGHNSMGVPASSASVCAPSPNHGDGMQAAASSEWPQEIPATTAAAAANDEDEWEDASDDGEEGEEEEDDENDGDEAEEEGSEESSENEDSNEDEEAEKHEEENEGEEGEEEPEADDDGAEEAPTAWDTEEKPEKPAKAEKKTKHVEVAVPKDPNEESSSTSSGEDDDDDDDNGRVKALPTLKRHPKDVLTLDVRAGITFMALSSSNLSGAERQRLGPDFPSRRLAKVALHWGADATEEKAVEVFNAIDKECQWTCGGCAKENSRLADQCIECKKDRVEDEDANKNRKVKVIAVLPKSKEAQEFRKKMHARLRSQYQKQLEALDSNFNGMNVI
ncbi:Hypothetical protein, putative [Bodo saltans]|uniref:RanBP2-type domain-containing protein n=1 Tax=Bodo saltans TaxID=75058 RepID=A0A0S4JAI6_BODSA|nr:Hypothetical protein, putative [Bodo saltans]|eukprot:CUG86470.1 Hypothetical protein, putative [Bodo saltans]